MTAGYATETAGSMSESSLSSDDLWVAQLQTESKLSADAYTVLSAVVVIFIIVRRCKLEFAQLQGQRVQESAQPSHEPSL